MPIITLRVSEAQKARFVEQAAELGFGSMSAYVRSCADSPVSQLVREIHAQVCNAPRADLPEAAREAVSALEQLQMPRTQAERRVTAILRVSPKAAAADLIRKATQHEA